MKNILKQFKNNSKKRINRYRLFNFIFRFYSFIIHSFIIFLILTILFFFSGNSSFQISNFIISIIIFFTVGGIIRFININYINFYRAKIDMIGQTIVAQRIVKRRVPFKYGRYMWSDGPLLYRLNNIILISTELYLPWWCFAGFEKNDYLYLLLGDLKHLWIHSNLCKGNKSETLYYLSTQHKFDYENYLNNEIDLDKLDFDKIIDELEIEINNLSELYSPLK